jgi:hypothetical protein
MSTELGKGHTVEDCWNGPAGGCLELMRAVLEDAIGCAQGTARRFQRDDRRALQTDAVQWLSSDRMSDPFDFRRICEALGVDPDAIRRRVLPRMKPIAPDPRSRVGDRADIRRSLIALASAPSPAASLAEQVDADRLSPLTAAAARSRKARRNADILARRAEGWPLDRLVDFFGLPASTIARILARAEDSERAVA